MIYSTDTNVQQGIFMDEDWGELVGNPDVTADPSGLYAIAGNLEPHYALDRSTSGSRQIKIAVCDPAASSDTLPQTITIVAGNGELSEDVADNSLYLSSWVGEKFRPVIALDTGIIDGDAD